MQINKQRIKINSLPIVISTDVFAIKCQCRQIMVAIAVITIVSSSAFFLPATQFAVLKGIHINPQTFPVSH